MQGRLDVGHCPWTTCRDRCSSLDPHPHVAMGECRLGRAASLLMVGGGQVDDPRELSTPGASRGVQLEGVDNVSKRRWRHGVAVCPLLPVVECLGEYLEVLDPCGASVPLV